MEVFFDERHLGVIDRDLFRQWLIDPDGTSFRADDMVWAFEAATLCLTIGGTAYFQIPHRTTCALRATI